MPDYTPILQTPIPLKPEADDVPAAMMAAFVNNEKASVPTVANIAERDERFNGTDVSLVVVQDPPSIWAKTGDSSWWRVASDTGWKYVNLLNGFTSANQIAYRVINLMCYWRGILKLPADYEPATYAAWCNVPAEAQPVAGLRFPMSTNHATAVAGSYSGGQMFVWAAENTSSFLPVPTPYVVAGD